MSINTKDMSLRKTKIVSSIGPATRSLEKIEQLFLSGVNVFRMNFSHDVHEEHKSTFENIRTVSKKYNVSLATLADMQGPKLRVGKFQEDKIFLEKDQKFILDMNSELGDSKRVCLPHPEIFEALKEGDYLLVDDGKVRLQVEKFSSNYAETRVIVPGYISNAKGVNFPSGILKLNALTEKDLRDLDYAISLGVDYIALSFVQLASDVEYAKSIIKNKAKIISKVEKPSAVEHIVDIVKVSDGIMVARGDLGVELPAHTVPAVQKLIIRECRRQSKPVIVATQMLDSMTNSPVPTRAEVSDVANAVYDGADAVMLSNETTVGKFPMETVTIMSNIIKDVEKDHLYWDSLDTSYRHITENHLKSNPEDKKLTTGRAISIATKNISESIGAEVIVTFSFKGTTVNRISHQRPNARILSLTDNKALFNQLSLNWGVTPLFVDKVSSFSEIVEIAENWLKTNNWVASGDKVVVVAGVPVNVGGITNSIRVIEIE